MPNIKVYMAGPIAGCTDEECKDWRNAIKEVFPNAIDPMVRDYREATGHYFREVVDLDKRDMRKSDVVLVNYVKPSVGTSMEVLYAWTIGKPIVVVRAIGTKLSPWLIYHSTTIVDSFSEAIEKIKFFHAA